MAEWPGLPAGYDLPLVNSSTKRLPDPTMDAIEQALIPTSAAIATEVVPTLVYWDTFDRADGDPGTAPSGQAYLTHYTNNQRSKIVDRQLVSQPQDGTSTGSGYIAVNLDRRPSVLVQRGLIFGSGSGQNSAMSVVIGGRADGAPVTHVNEIIDRCLHLILTRTGISVQYRDAANGAPVSGPTWALSLVRNNGTEYEWQVRYLADDTIEVIDPNGASHVLTDPRVESLSGRSVYFQAVNQSQATPTPGDETRLTGMWIFDGVAGAVPAPEQMIRHPQNARTLARAIRNTSGQPDNRLEVLSRELPTASGGLVDGRLQLTYFTPVDEFVVARVEACAGATAVVGASLIRFGLYEVDRLDNLRLIAATVNDATLFSTVNAVTSKSLGGVGALPGTYRLRPGKRYAVGVLVYGSSNAGTIQGATVNAVLASIAPGRINGTVTGLTDLPDTVAVGSIGSSSLRPWFRFWAP